MFGSQRTRLAGKSDEVRVAQSVLLTLAYSDQFLYPLSLSQIEQRMVRARVARAHLSHILESLEQGGLITSALGASGVRFFCLATSDIHAMMGRREELEQRALTKWHEVRRLCAFARFIPFIEGVAITGSVALNQAVDQADIDFLIVTRPGTLWLARPLVVFFAWLMGKRRSWSHEEGNSWCFNLWLESNALCLGRARHTLYSAYELLQAEWVWDTVHTAHRMYLENGWARDYLPEYYRQRLELSSSNSSASGASAGGVPSPIWQRILADLVQLCVELLAPLLYGLNAVLYLAQRLYMRSHITHEDVSWSKAFFHPRNTRSLLTRGWADSLALFIHGIELLHRRPVLVTGVFDVLHEEHRRFLERARQLADRENAPLVVAIESDVRVRQMKGETRPIFPQAKRMQNLRELGLADLVFVLPEQFATPADRMRLLQALRPRALAVSSHSPHLDAKRAMMSQVGGRVEVVHEHNPAISTTLLVSSGKYDTTERETELRT